MRYVSFVLLLQLAFARASLLLRPEIAWSMPLAGTTVQGNAVVEINEQLLAVTTASGVLHLVHLGASGNFSVAFTPDPVAGLDAVACQSGAIVISDVVVYAVTHTDLGRRLPSNSSVMAVNATTSAFSWSVSIEGVVAGTPVWSKSSNTLFVVHNVERRGGGGRRMFVGVVTVLKIVDADTEPTVVATLPSTPTGRRFGPGAGVKDVIFFADAGGRGSVFGDVGALYAVTGKNFSYHFSLASSLIGSTTTAPAVSDALDVYLGQEANTMIAWRGGNATSGGITTPSWADPLQQAPSNSWMYPLQQDPNNQYAPLPSSPVLSTNGNIVFAASSVSQAMAFPLGKGSTPWTAHEAVTTVLAKAVYQETTTGAAVVYFMESVGGILRQYDAATGHLNWAVDCGSGSCGAVVAEFTVSSNGKMLYYADTLGNLVAVAIANPVPEAPSWAPTVGVTISDPKGVMATDNPVASPNARPFSSSVATEAPSIALVFNNVGGIAGDVNSNSLSLMGGGKLIIVLSTVCGTLFAIIGLAVLFFWSKKRQLGPRSMKPRSLQSPAADDASTGVARNDDGGHGNIFIGTHSTLPSIEESPLDEEQASGDVEIGMSRRYATAAHEAAVVRDLSDSFFMATMDSEGQGNRSKIYDPHLLAYERGVLYGVASVARDEGFRNTGNTVVTAAAGASATTSRSDGFKADSVTSEKWNEQSYSVPGRGGLPDFLRVMSLAAGSRDDVERTELGDPKFIQRFHATLSPSPSLDPECPDPGCIRRGRKDPTCDTSSIGSSFSFDDSPDIAKFSVASLEVPLYQQSTVSPNETSLELPISCYDDEANKALQPGSFYECRSMVGNDRVPTTPERNYFISDAENSRPVDMGLSARLAGRPRTGEFSCRQSNMSSIDYVTAFADPVVETRSIGDGGTASDCRGLKAWKSSIPSATEHRASTSPQRLPIPRRRGKLEGNGSNLLAVGEERKLKPAPTQPRDPWRSILIELSGVESQFFDSTAEASTRKEKPALGIPGRPPTDVSDDFYSDDDIEPPYHAPS